MKKIVSVLLSVLCAFSALGMACLSASAVDEDGWTTVTSFNDEVGEGWASVSAKGNEIRITITSAWINGDRIYCAGTEGCVSDEWEDAIGRHALLLDFADYDTIEEQASPKNALRFSIRHDCGKHQTEHSFSLKNDACIFLNYYFETEKQGQYDGILGTGYHGTLAECTEMDISVSGNTLTMTTTLPSTVVDYRDGSTRELCFDSEKLQCVGLSTSPYYDFGDKPLDPDAQPETVFQIMLRRIRVFVNKMRELYNKLVRYLYSIVGDPA